MSTKSFLPSCRLKDSLAWLKVSAACSCLLCLANQFFFLVLLTVEIDGRVWVNDRQNFDSPLRETSKTWGKSMIGLP